MHEERAPDRNLLIAMAVAAALGLVWHLLLTARPHDAEVNAGIAQEVHERACIAQYGPGERLKKPEVCVLGTRDVPATALSYPLAKQ